MRSEVQLFEAVQSAICTVLDVEGGEVTKDANIVADLGAESIDFLDISCELEKEIDFELDFKEVIGARQADAGDSQNDLTVGQVVEYLQTKKA